MCIRSNGALAVGLAALTATAGTPLAASLRAHAHEWSCAADERRPARTPPVSVRALDGFEVGVPVEVQRVQPQVVDGQLAIEVIEVTSGPLPSDSAELYRPDAWDLLPGESALYGIEIARSVHFCDAIA